MAVTDEQFAALQLQVTDATTSITDLETRVTALETRATAAEQFVNDNLPKINAALAQLTEIGTWKADTMDPAMIKLAATLKNLPTPK